MSNVLSFLTLTLGPIPFVIASWILLWVAYWIVVRIIR